MTKPAEHRDLRWEAQPFHRPAEAQALAGIKARSAPPVEMLAAPAAPARGAMHLAPDYAVTAGGMRVQTGAHWQTCDGLAAMVGRALQRHRASGTDAPFEPPFTAAQLAVAGRYRTLVEWREGSALKCASLEVGRGGGGGDGPKGYMDRFIDRGDDLARLVSAIGGGAVLRVQRKGGDGRRTVTAQRLVDLVVLQDCDLTDVLRRHGWLKDRANRNHLRKGLCAALDRMAQVVFKAP